jgi:hypothetical protein
LITQIVLFFISILLIIIKIKIFIAQIILFFIVILLVILKIKIFKIFHHIQYNWVTQDPLSWGYDTGPKTIESCLRLKIRLSGPLPWPKCVGSPQATPITKLGCVHAHLQVGSWHVRIQSQVGSRSVRAQPQVGYFLIKHYGLLQIIIFSF